MGTLRGDLCAFVIISRSNLLRMRNVSGESCRGIQNTNFVFKNRAVYEMMWKNIVEPAKPQMTIQCGVCAFYDGYLRLQTNAENL